MAFFPEICAELRKLCFTRTDDSRAGGERLVTYVLVVPDRTLTVQLWEDGRHRVSMDVWGNSDVFPEYFRTVDGLRRAIQLQLGYEGSKYQDPAHWRTLYPERHGIFY